MDSSAGQYGMNSTKTVAKNLKKIMEAKGLSQNRLHELSGISQSSVGRIMEGKVAPRVDSIDAIAKAIGCQPWQLLVPDLDPQNLPALRAITAEERKLYENLRLAAQDLAKYKP
jgi:transcriptional regulator with XRE-family HTH domain